MTLEQLIQQAATYIHKYAPQYNIKVCSPILGQLILESGRGTSELAVKANNYLGIKYKEGRCPSAIGIYYKDGSEQDPNTGEYVTSAMKWCLFKDLEGCIRGYMDFTSHSRYAAIKGVKDPQTYLERIKAAGYATSINYVTNVMNVIKSYDLTRFDNMGTTATTTPSTTAQKLKVYLDPGHFGSTYNRTTTGLNYYESAMTWKLAGYLKAELEQRNVVVTLSRNTIGANPALYDRGYGAKGYDLFLSLHSNACGTESFDYPIVYRGYDKTEANDFAQKFANMVATLMGTTQAGKVGTRTGTDGEYYGVLRGARAAGLTHYYIVEHSFHTNKRATQWLMSDDNLKLLAKEEAKFIVDYFVNKKTSAPSVSTVTNSSATSSSTAFQAGEQLTLKSNKVYTSSASNSKYTTKSGTFYIWSNDVVNGRIRITNSKARVGVAGQVTGWINVSDFKTTTTSSATTTTTPSVTGNYSLIFDAVYYANAYADLKKAFGTNKTKLLEHFKAYGMKEGRKACESFDVKVYKDNNADLRKAFGAAGYERYFQHYLEYGYKENRKCV